MIQHIRDDSHNHAITGHRNKRAKVKIPARWKASRASAKRRQQLLKYMGGLQPLMNASVEEIAKVPGISHATAENLLLVKTLALKPRWQCSNIQVNPTHARQLAYLMQLNIPTWLTLFRVVLIPFLYWHSICRSTGDRWHALSSLWWRRLPTGLTAFWPALETVHPFRRLSRSGG